MLRTFVALLRAIRFEQTAFALPFALTSAFVAAGGWPRLWDLGWILVAMVGARTAGMAFNRLVDADYDRQNPRTAKRALVTGELSRPQVQLLLVLALVAYFLAAGMLNRLCLLLSPLALVVLLGYSYTKRFTVLTHWVRGAALGIAPVGAWIAVRGHVGLASLALGAAVMMWTAGFDIIYACQDIAFDRAHGLFSLPARWGARRALVISSLNHLITVWLLLLFARLADLGAIYLLGVLVLIPVLWYEHHVVQPEDLSRAEVASFFANGVFSIVLFCFAAADVILGPNVFLRL